MITIDTLHFTPYTCVIMGNSGEEALVIMYSPSQGPASPLAAATIQCDGGMKILALDWLGRIMPTGALVQHDDFRAVIDRIILEWAGEKHPITVESVCRHFNYRT